MAMDPANQKLWQQFNKPTCKSFIGFQSCSMNITVSAPVRFRPSPPTCVVNNKTSIDGSLLNLAEQYKKQLTYHSKTATMIKNFAMLTLQSTKDLNKIF